MEELEIQTTDPVVETQTTINYEEQGLYNLEIESLNTIVIQNYIIIGLLFCFMLMKRKWRSI